MQAEKQKTYNLEELRKTHPRMGMKWHKDEDERLKKLYEEQRTSGFKDFEAFIFEMSQKFQRAAGGLKARMAMHFNDVPGWDYGMQEQRANELARLAEEKVSTDKNDWLKEEYKKYIETKQETYIGFLKRLSFQLKGVEGKFISHRLNQLHGPLQKYLRDDVNVYAPANKERPEEEIPQLDLSSNPQMQEALRIMGETSENLFLTGEAGTGKSTLLQYFRKTTEKNVVVLAPTGVAALNVEGQTIHSFCSFGPDITLQKVKKLAPFNPKVKLLKNLQTLIIDEISMVRADLLDFVDKFLKLNGPMPGLPFGGIQVICIGDLYQLPPVEKDFGAGNSLIKEYNSPYFFDSRVFGAANFKFVELKTIYRQKDQVFKDVLNAVRNNVASQEHLELLNSRASG
ncbi:MAG TPA: AAA family ATPase, partial [Candidatus Limnocylindria bacterium]|nr:AAA family ATPase [Candidatus Limnocylindria bacterium]